MRPMPPSAIHPSRIDSALSRSGRLQAVPPLSEEMKYASTPAQGGWESQSSETVSYTSPRRAERPAVVASTAKPGTSECRPAPRTVVGIRTGWDHVTPYLTHILRDLWGLDLAIARAELTLADVNPAMAHLRDAAAHRVGAESSGDHDRGLVRHLHPV